MAIATAEMCSSLVRSVPRARRALLTQWRMTVKKPYLDEMLQAPGMNGSHLLLRCDAETSATGCWIARPTPMARRSGPLSGQPDRVHRRDPPAWMQAPQVLPVLRNASISPTKGWKNLENEADIQGKGTHGSE